MIQLLFVESKDSQSKKGGSAAVNTVTGPLEDEFTNYFSIPYGYVLRYKFTIEKKEHHLFDLETKDQRKMRFRFESPFQHQRAQDALHKHSEITKHRDLFTYDFSKRIKAENSWQVVHG